MHRAFAAIVVAVIATIALSGCSALGAVGTSIRQVALGATLRPIDGLCWRAPDSAIARDATWSSGLPVDCSTSHTAYTFAVPPLSKSFSGSWRRAGSAEALRSDISDAALADCTREEARFLPALDTKKHRLFLSYFVPSIAAWNAGARWVRCDIALVAFGSALFAPTFLPLPTNIDELVGEVTELPLKYALCIDTGDPSGSTDPYHGPFSTYSDCTDRPQWQEASTAELPSATLVLPDVDSLLAFEQRWCGDAAEAEGNLWFAYAPTGESWAAGDRRVECWVSTGADSRAA